MFKNRQRRLTFIEEPIGDNGGAGPIENSAPVEGGETNALGGTLAQPVKENPAWSQYVDQFPDVVKPQARTIFSQWDKDVQSRFQGIHEQYKPFKSFIDNGVNPEELNSAWEIAQIMQRDPQGFTRLLAEQLGLSIEEAQALEEAVENDDEYDDPRYEQLQSQVQQLSNFIEQQQQQQIAMQQQQEVEQQLDNEFNELEAKYGKLSPTIKNQVLREALRIVNETNQPVTMEQAYNSLEQFVREVREVPRPGTNAPPVLPGGGGMPLTPAGKSPGQMTATERKARAAEVAARLLAQQS